MENKLVSVVIPTYNRKDVIMRAVNSVLNQTYAKLELIVVDDGSADGTAELLKKMEDKRLIIIRTNENKGACHARNIGVEAASGYYVAFQDSDDEWMENKVEEQIAFMEQKGVQVCFSPYILADKDEIAVIPANYKDINYFTNMKDILKEGNVIGLPTLIAKKSVLDKLEYVFCENLPCLQDYELALRIIQNTEIGYYPIPLVKAYRMEDSITNNMKKYVAAVRDIVIKHQQYVDVNNWMRNIVYYRSIMPDLAEIYDKEMEWDRVPDEIQKIYRKTISDHNYKLLDFDTADKWKEEKIIIYGAGDYGKELCKYLELIGLSNNIVCFAVTKKAGNADEYRRKKINEVYRVQKELRECIVLVAMKIEYAEKVFPLLQEYHAMKIYYVDSAFIQNIPEKRFLAMCNVPLVHNKVFLSSYHGSGYRCNCKYIAEEILRKKYPAQLVWVIQDEKVRKELPNSMKAVMKDSPEYYQELYTSKVCIVNNDNRFITDYKREGQYYINVWHGYGPFKKVAASCPYNYEPKEIIKNNYAKYDLFVTASTFYSEIYRSSFLYEGEILECGAPRNDIFYKGNECRNRILKEFGISSDKKIVLYAPTFRSDVEASFDKYDIDMAGILDALKIRFNCKFVLMYRFHHMLYALKDDWVFYEDGIDVTFYPDVQELLVAADVLITDYSSIMWDFSLQGKPVFLYLKDEEAYVRESGLYSLPREWPYPKAGNQKALEQIITGFDERYYRQELNAFFQKYGSCDDGHASEHVVKRIMDVISDK